MNRRTTFLALATLAFGAHGAQAQWVEQFDTYNLGRIAAQSLWEEWDGSSGVDGRVVASPTLTLDRALQITGQPVPPGSPGNDTVYNFVNLPSGQPTSGKYICSARTYIPSSADGTGWFIMLNSYPTPKNWSLQVQFQTATNTVAPVEPAGTTVNLIRDEWVSLVTCIDLDNDRVDVYYGNQTVVENGPWIANGSKQIACVDLYGDEPATPGIKEMYYDNIRLEKTGPGMALGSNPSAVMDGGNLTIELDAPQAKSGRGFLYIWSVNDIPYRLRLLNVNLDSAGEWSFNANLPTGLAGLEIGMKAFCIPQGGGAVNESNVDLIVIQ
jgi:hypothetical protein